MHRFRLPLLCCFLLVAFGTGWYLFDNYKKTDPIMVSKEFLAKIAQGDIKTAKSYFGGRCACVIPGGWISYLIYKSGQEPNLAYLVGARFSMGDFCKKIEMPDSQDLQQKRCLVTIPITFSGDDRPFFLPVKMAFGKTIEESELLHFSHNPGKEWQKGFTLRLRPSISKGAIDHAAMSETMNANSSLLSNYEKQAQDLFRLLGNDVITFLPPADAGPVTRGDKTFLKQYEVEKLLPRVQKISISLLLVQKAGTPYWLVTQCKSTKPILQVVNGNLTALKEPIASSM
jgi:hypothetical protein